MERELKHAMDIVVQHHNKCPSHYYLGEGSEEGVANAKMVLKFLHLLSRQCSESFIYDSSAIPVHELFRDIKGHLDQIIHFYVSKETELLQEILRRILPSNPNPLRFIVLSSMSLFTARVYIHAKELIPDPIQAYVDGYFNLVIDLNDTVARIPILPDPTTKENFTIPPSLRFKGVSPEDEARIRQFVFNESPKIGRRNQFAAFISVLNSNRPPSDYITSFRNSLCSMDMSFATAICLLARQHSDYASLQNLFLVLGCDNVIDLFLRELSVASLGVVQGFQVAQNINIVALTNLFMAMSGEWAARITMQKGIADMIHDICMSITHRYIPFEALYVLRAALCIAAYDDAKGSSAISMFLELAVRPFTIASKQIDQFESLKKGFLFGDKTYAQSLELVQRTVVHILGAEIPVTFSPMNVNPALRDIHEYIMSRIDDFIDTVIVLNQRPKLEHPLMQMLLFSYQMAYKHGLIE